MAHVRMAAISAVALPVFFLCPAQTRASCSRWDMPARTEIRQSNDTSFTVETSPVQDGFVGKAYLDSMNESSGHIGRIYGDLEGTVTGSNVRFTIHWGRDFIKGIGAARGVYTGTVGPQGRLEGDSYDAAHPQSRASWWAREVLRCHAASTQLGPPAPPPKALGRVRSSTPRAGPPVTTMCEAARSARSRNSPAAPNLERQCAAQQAIVPN
jgi:hypothetical protein